MYYARVFLYIIILTSFVFAFGQDGHIKDFEAPRIFFLLTLCFIVGSIVDFFMRTFRLPLSQSAMVMFFGCLMGLGIEYETTHFLEIEFSAINADPRFILLLYFPIILFKLTISVDVHTFSKSAIQIGLLSTVGTLLHAFLVGSVMGVLIRGMENYSFERAMLYGMIATYKYPVDAIQLLEEMGPMNKHIVNLLKGECVLGCVVYDLILRVGNDIAESPDYEKNTDLKMAYLAFCTIFKNIAGGIVFGLVGGTILTILVKAFQKDIVNILAISFVFPVLLNYITDINLSMSGLLPLFITAFMLNKSQISSKVKKNLLEFHDVLSYVADTLLSFIVGVHMVKFAVHDSRVNNYAQVLVVYLFASAARFVVLVIFSPLLSRTGYGWTFKNLIVAWVGGISGSYVYFVAVIERNVNPELPKDILLHSFGIIFLTNFINVPLLIALLKILKIAEVPKAMKINMNYCINQILNQKEKKICVLKTDRFLSDANWPVIQQKTIIKNPFARKETDSDEESESSYFFNKGAVCPDCMEEVKREPTKKEFDEMVRIARIRILKTRRISYLKQFESGMLTKEGLYVLSHAIDLALDSEDKLIPLDSLFQMFKQKGTYFFVRSICMHILMLNKRPPTREPLRPLRRLCYRIMRNVWFQVVMGVIILVNLIQIHVKHLLTLKIEAATAFYLIFAMKVVFLIMYTFEIVVKILGLSVLHIKEGLKLYFKSFFNIMDVVSTVVVFMHIIVGITYMDERNKYPQMEKIIFYLKYIRWFGIQRTIRFLLWVVVKLCEYRIESRLSVAYDLGKAYISADEEIIDKIDYMIDNKAVKDIVRQSIYQHKLELTRELGLLQENRPWMSITLKSKQALRTTLNSMKDAIFELKEHGWADDSEYNKLMESLEERYTFLRSVRRIDPNSPEVQFKAINWAMEDEYIADYLLAHAKIYSFKAGEIIAKEGEYFGGLYVIITGIMKMNYNPCAEVLQKMRDFGILPNIDCIISTRFDKKYEEYLISGNSIGEMEICSGRPLNATYVASTNVRLYFLPTQLVQNAFEISADPVYGLESRMWKAVGLKMSQAILNEVPSYQFTPEHKIKLMTERAMVPRTDYYKVFVITKLIENVILLEGVVMDYNTKYMYKAPCYIPRNVQKIILPKSGEINIDNQVETRLFIIPMSGVDGYEVMLQEEFIAEFDRTMPIGNIFKTIKNLAFKRAKRQQNFEIVRKNTRRRYKGSEATVDTASSKNLIEVKPKTQYFKTQLGVKKSKSSLNDDRAESEVGSNKMPAAGSKELNLGWDKVASQLIEDKTEYKLGTKSDLDYPSTSSKDQFKDVKKTDEK